MAYNYSAMEEALNSVLKTTHTFSKQLISPFYPGYSIVFIDLEATGLQPNCEIIQIAAKCGSKTFNTYIIPKKGIPNRIKDLTGLHMTQNQMYSRDIPVTGVSKKIGLTKFLNFLESLGGKTILVAHNCFNFDGPMLAGMAIELNMTGEFQKVVAGFSDTLPLFRRRLPGRRERGKSYGMVAMAGEFLGASAGAHDASNDVEMLENLVLHEKINLKFQDFMGMRKDVNFMVLKFRRNWEEFRRNPAGWRDWY